MPKLKTHKGASKRFKVTANGKIKRSKAFGVTLADQEKFQTQTGPEEGDAMWSSRNSRKCKELLPYSK